jgi:Ricin-type beta-trefoil lectin domain-like
MKRIALVIAFAVAAVGFGGATPASAFDGNPHRIVNVRYGECLDQVGGAPTNGTPIGHYPCDGAARQLWFIEPRGSVLVCTLRHPNGTCFVLTAYPAHRIRSVSSGMCVDIHNNGTASGTILEQHPCNELTQQKWIAEPGPNGSRYFINGWAFANTEIRRVLDAPPFSQDYRVRLWTFGAFTSQAWYVQ